MVLASARWLACRTLALFSVMFGTILVACTQPVSALEPAETDLGPFVTLEVPTPFPIRRYVVAAESASTIHLVAQHHQNVELFYSKATLDEAGLALQAWTPLNSLAAPGALIPFGGDFPAMAASNGLVSLMWQIHGETHQDTTLVTSYVMNQPEGRWSPPVRVYAHEGRQTLPSVSCRDGACYAAWQEESTPNLGDWRIYGAQIAPTLGAKVLLQSGDPSITGEFPSLSFDASGDAIVAWAATTPSGTDIRVSEWDVESPGAGIEVSIIRDSGNDGTASFPSIAGGTHPATVWQTSAINSPGAIGFSRMNSESGADVLGEPWSAARHVPLVSDQSAPSHPRIYEFPGDRLLLSWEDATWGLPRIVMAFFDVKEGVFGSVDAVYVEGDARSMQAKAAVLALNEGPLVFFKEEGVVNRLLVSTNAGSFEVTVLKGGNSPGLGLLLAITVFVTAMIRARGCRMSVKG